MLVVCGDDDHVQIFLALLIYDVMFLCVPKRINKKNVCTKYQHADHIHTIKRGSGSTAY